MFLRTGLLTTPLLSWPSCSLTPRYASSTELYCKDLSEDLSSHFPFLPYVAGETGRSFWSLLDSQHELGTLCVDACKLGISWPG